jgi:rod shape-determining protein MreC
MVQNEILKKEIGILGQKLIEYDDVVLENARLSALFDFKQKTSYKVIAARVVGSSADDWSSVAIINKGVYHGIKNGYVAVSYKGLIGRVIEAGSRTSKVMLINDPNLSVSAAVQRSRQEGLVSGSLSGSLAMRYLPLESDIAVSDTIITSGLSQIYPKGIPIGKVVSVGYEFSGLSRYALLKPFVELSRLEEVLIIIP